MPIAFFVFDAVAMVGLDWIGLDWIGLVDALHHQSIFK
jgi:hypothetical protein